jgi:predicted Fe-S protein YdhL (DUF1289 family)
MAKFDWHSMTEDEKLAFVRDSVERHHEQRYLAALAFYDRTGPAWEDLTEEQRENVREENRRYDREMQAFGESLRGA